MPQAIVPSRVVLDCSATQTELNRKLCFLYFKWIYQIVPKALSTRGFYTLGKMADTTRRFDYSIIHLILQVPLSDMKILTIWPF